MTEPREGKGVIFSCEWMRVLIALNWLLGEA